MELRQYLSLVWKWAWLIALSVLVAGGTSFMASRAATPLYGTKTTLMVGRAIQNPDTNSSDLYTGQQLAYIYSQLAVREPVLQGAIEKLGLEMNWQALAGQVSAYNIYQTQLLEISVTDSDPYRAKVLADAIAQQLIMQSPGANTSASTEDLAFIRSQLSDLKTKISAGEEEIKRLRQELDAANSALQIQDLRNQVNLLETKIGEWQSNYSQLLITLQGGDINVLSIIEEATIPSIPISPNTRMNVLLASAVGLVLALAGAILVEYLDDTLKTTADVERAAGMPGLGVIAKIRGETYAEKLIAAKKPLDPSVEAFRVLRTNLQYSSVDRPISTLLVSSPGPGEGKSVCLANLAVVMAQSGLKVVVVDADLRRPVQHKIFDLPNRSGLSDAALQNHLNATRYLQATEVENLHVLTSGPLPPNPSRLLESERMNEILRVLKNAADILLIDSPPVLAVADAILLSTQIDGVILVGDSGHTRKGDLKRAVGELNKVHANLLGMILNRYKNDHGNAYYYDYYYSADGAKEKKNRFRGLRRWFARRDHAQEAFNANDTGP